MGPEIANDHDLARDIRQRVRELRDTITNARERGLSIEVPELVHMYLNMGTASGSPSDWKIYRAH